MSTTQGTPGLHACSYCNQNVKCICGHSSDNHINGTGLCIVKFCPLCLIYRPVSDGPSVASNP